MPRYFFHIHDGRSLPDTDGTDLPDTQAARAQAMCFAGEVVREMGMTSRNCPEWRLEVADERGRVLYVLRFLVEEPPSPS